MARIVDESFEGTGYEESWSETVGIDCTCDEDSSGPGSLPAGGGSQCLYIVKANDYEVYITRNTGQNVSPCYIRFYVYFSSLSSADGFAQHFVSSSVFNGNITGTTVNIGFRRSGSNYNFRLGYHTSAGWQYQYDSNNIATGQWYRIEAKFDDSGSGSHELRVDGATVATGTGNLDRGLPYNFYIGNPASGYALTGYFDLFTVDNETWVGAEEMPVSALPRRAIDGPFYGSLRGSVR